MQRRRLISGVAAGAVAVPLTALATTSTANAQDVDKVKHRQSTSTEGSAIVGNIDPTEDAYGKSYTATVDLSGPPENDEYATVTVDFRVEVTNGQGTFQAFTAADMENLVTQLLSSYRSQFAGSASANPVRFTEQVTLTATTNLS
ncbi:hypothetical protein Athai_39840 [Actinocatenispora thailandica]|uniref:Tat pathway signal sequence domain protein n=1 Tax=Actinocatenispora thailandica TaxID=227318 RepID=A0A7R7DRQ2_9ACTN|nr:hypothetical protein [Actinocatenispora thailandica]BCJ36481.1 hypothetical protein Athai_39840 [Actinocatenispora thailandica]